MPADDERPAAEGPAAEGQPAWDPVRALLAAVRLGPAQVAGGIRMIPVVRDRPVEGLRLSPLLYEDRSAIVDADRRNDYVGYVPHAFVADWVGDGTPAAAYGTRLLDGGARTGRQSARDDPPGPGNRRGRRGPRSGRGRPGTGDEEKVPSVPSLSLRFQRRMARRTGKHRMRFLPQHLALHGYLSLHFGGPTVAWEEWSRRAIERGLSPRVEAAYVGDRVPGLADALRIFELHERQCGALLYVGEELASAFVVGHPEDFRALYPTLLHDLYGELLYQHGLLARHGPRAPELSTSIRDTEVRTLADLRAEAERAISAEETYHRQVAEHHLSGPVGAPAVGSAAGSALADGTPAERYRVRTVHRVGPFRLARFLPSFWREGASHIGEVITDGDGAPVYLKTFRLSTAQAKRGHLLDVLAAHDWHLASAGAALGCDEAQVAARLDAVGLGYLLREDILARFRRGPE